jgi:hypothetical protein
MSKSSPGRVSGPRMGKRETEMRTAHLNPKHIHRAPFRSMGRQQVCRGLGNNVPSLNFCGNPGLPVLILSSAMLKRKIS